MRMLRTLSATLAVGLLAGCQLVVDFDRTMIGDGGSDADTGTGDTSADTAMDTSTDATDSAMDSSADAPTDTMGDAPADTMSDAPMDAPMDAPTDAPTDTTMDGADTAVTPVCGDGVMEGTEACDDGNMLACGTCSADCMTAQPITAATGTITTPAAAMLLDTETFTLDDGVNAATVFELDTNATVGGANVAVDISGATTADEVRDAIIAAINGVAAPLAITAASGGAGVVDLTNDAGGDFGNVLIARTVADTGFVTSGMAGGVAADCVTGDGCVGADDCTGTCTSMLCD